MNEKNEAKEFSLTKGASRHGTMSLIMIVVVVVIIIILNLIVGRLPKNILQFDISDQRLYDISDTSREFVKGLDTDVELLLLSELGTTDERISKFVDNYAAMSSHISVETIDPVLYPSVLDTYTCTLNSLVVKNSETGKFRVVPFTGTENSLIIYGLDFSTYEYYEKGFDADGQITSAIAYVASDSSGVIYATCGHGETELGDTAVGIIEKSNLTLNSSRLDILMNGGIPENCDMLIINAPTSDISSDEADALIEYLRHGGDIFLCMSLEDAPNFQKVLNEYGMSMRKGFVGDTSRYYQQYTNFYGFMCIAPLMSAANEITAGIKQNAFVIYPKGMDLIAPARDTIEVSSFMYTSDDGILYIDDDNVENGRFDIAALATEDTENGQTRFTVVLSTSVFSEEVFTSLPSMSNATIFTNIITCGFEDANRFVIPQKNLDVGRNTITNYGWWSVLYIGIIPACVFVGGLIYWLRRRKR